MNHGNVAPLATLCPGTLPRCNVRMKAVSFRNTRCHVRGRRAVADVLILNAHVGSPIATPHTTHRTWHSARDVCQAETTRGHVACRRVPALGPTDRPLPEDRPGARPPWSYLFALVAAFDDAATSRTSSAVICPLFSV